MNKLNRQLKKQMKKASLLNKRFGLACLRDPGLSRLLVDLRGLICKTDSVMVQSGIVSACARCAEIKGSCCFREMGESYGFMGLFVNLLLGSELPQKDDSPGSCHFVGESGCRLQARQSFCLNYFCPDLRNSLGETTVLRIQKQAGEQLFTGWELERALARYLENADKQD